MKARRKSKRKLREERFKQIPEQLQQLKQWVPWKAESGTGKVPYNPNYPRRKAKSTDPTTWSSFEKALAVSNKGFDGIGFVVTENDEYIVIDIDGCRDPDSGKIAEWAMKIVRLLDSYTEVSPSGTGLRIVMKAKFPEEEKKAFRTIKPIVHQKYGNRTPEIMAARSRHYFTMTGNVLEDFSNKVEDRQEEFLQLYDKHFRKKPVAKKQKTKRKVKAAKKDEIVSLLDECLEKHDDRSTADFHFCCEAIRKGWAKDSIWESVRDESKFATDGRDYFDRTRDNAAPVVDTDSEKNSHATQLIDLIYNLSPIFFYPPGEKSKGYISVQETDFWENYEISSD